MTRVNVQHWTKVKPKFPPRKGILSSSMINGTADQTAQIVYKKITITSLVLFSLLLLKLPSALFIVSASRSQLQLPKCLNSMFISWLSDCAWFYVWSGGEDVMQVCTTSRAHKFSCQRLEWQLSFIVSCLCLHSFSLPCFPSLSLFAKWLNSTLALWMWFKHQTFYRHSCGMHGNERTYIHSSALLRVGGKWVLCWWSWCDGSDYQAAEISAIVSLSYQTSLFFLFDCCCGLTFSVKTFISILNFSSFMEV